MGILDFIKKPIKELYIARPPAAAEHLIWMHPDRTVPRGSKLKVRSDEVCVFFRNGRVCGTLEAGDYRLDSGNIPFLGELLIDPLTDGNHYLAELFFVRKAEYLQKSGARNLGTHHDLMSGHMVTLIYNIHFGVKVTDPVALITTLGGMEASSAEKVGSFLNGRIQSHLRAAIGNLMSQVPALRVVSNQFNEEIGQEVHKLCEEQFKTQGLKLTRFVTMTLALDEESEDALREFGSARADLAIQREGSQIANNPGFSNFHIAQGQRTALEGLGTGMATGGNSSPILGVGIGLGMGGGGPMTGGGGGGQPSTPLLPTGSGTASTTPIHTDARRAPSTMRWYLRTSRGTEGPYTIRQLVLRSLAEDETVETAVIRGEDDPDWFSAGDEESVRKEFERRQKNRSKSQSKDRSEDEKKGVAPFETLFSVAVEDQILTREEINLLAPLAVAAGMAQDIAGAQRIVIQRAKAYGCEVEPEFEAQVAATEENSTAGAPPPPRPSTQAPPPPRPTMYAYDNGTETLHDLTASQVMESVKTNPEGNHLVWSPGMTNWVAVNDVPEIQSLLGTDEE
jgi:membrane protease subunit (stomatin/prohibitin family)